MSKSNFRAGKAVARKALEARFWSSFCRWSAAAGFPTRLASIRAATALSAHIGLPLAFRVKQLSVDELRSAIFFMQTNRL